MVPQTILFLITGLPPVCFSVFLSGYNRLANISYNEFSWIGETAISQWGYTDGSPVPGMG